MSGKIQASPNRDTLSPETLKTAMELWGGAGEAHYLPVTGGSMVPLLRDGDQVFVAPSRDVKIGDVVVFQRSDELLTHRVLWIKTAATGERTLYTKGDRVLSMDEPVVESEMVGRVAAIRRGSRQMTLVTPAQETIGKTIAGLMRLQAELYQKAVLETSGTFSAGASIAGKSLSRVLLWVGNAMTWILQSAFGRWTG